MNETQVVLEERVPQPTLSIRQTNPLSELQQAQGERLGAPWRFIQRRGVQPAGRPFVRYHTFGTETTTHDTSAEAYTRLQAGLEEHGRDAAGAGWEAYEWIDPAVEPNPASWPGPSRWRTRLIQPVKSTDATT